MAEKRMLRMKYSGDFVDIEVENVDKCTIMDVFIDLYEAAGKKGMNLPKHPIIQYWKKQGNTYKCLGVTNDDEMMKMLEVLEGEKQIDIYLGSVKKPCEGLVLARNVMRKNAMVMQLPKRYYPPDFSDEESSNEGVAARNPPNAPNATQSPNGKSKRVKHMTLGKNLPSKSPRKLAQTTGPTPPPHVPHMPSPPAASHIPSPSPPSDLRPQDEPSPTYTPVSVPSVPKGRKVPPTTARRRGLLVRRIESATAHPSSRVENKSDNVVNTKGVYVVSTSSHIPPQPSQPDLRPQDEPLPTYTPGSAPSVPTGRKVPPTTARRKGLPIGRGESAIAQPSFGRENKSSNVVHTKGVYVVSSSSHIPSPSPPPQPPQLDLRPQDEPLPTCTPVNAQSVPKGRKVPPTIARRKGLLVRRSESATAQPSSGVENKSGNVVHTKGVYVVSSSSHIPSPPPQPPQPDLRPQDEPLPTYTPISAPSVPKGRKVPPTTARRKGLPVRRSEFATTQPSSGRESKSNNVVHTEGVYVVSSSSDDSNYEPLCEEMDVEEDNLDAISIELDDEGNSGDEIPLHDEIDLHPEVNAWADVDDSYWGKMYENGVIFQDTDFGSIDLQPWHLFNDKNHFKDMLTDYCIQEGFSIIVVKSDPTRHTAECATKDCKWRIHASRLPDGVTWAIKTIADVEHSCSKLQGHNPMATVEWAAKKVMEDVRANPDLSPNALNNMLFERFGVKLKKSSMYKMRDIAVKQI